VLVHARETWESPECRHLSEVRPSLRADELRFMDRHQHADKYGVVLQHCVTEKSFQTNAVVSR
jgi:hypothetical protein